MANENAARKAPPTITTEEFEEAQESYLGWCRACKEFTTDSCEPDAENYECDSCGGHRVVGAENALIMGCFEVVD